VTRSAKTAKDLKGAERPTQCRRLAVGDYGAVSRSLQLPTGVKADKASAKFENGVRTLTLPKTEEAKPKHIKVPVESS
jgi:HSP20 family molecular chaperone IbpA